MTPTQTTLHIFTFMLMMFVNNKNIQNSYLSNSVAHQKLKQAFINTATLFALPTMFIIMSNLVLCITHVQQ